MHIRLLKFQVKRPRIWDDRGATAVEYGLMVALIAIVIIAAVATLAATSAASSTRSHQASRGHEVHEYWRLDRAEVVSDVSETAYALLVPVGMTGFQPAAP